MPIYTILLPPVVDSKGVSQVEKINLSEKNAQSLLASKTIALPAAPPKEVVPQETAPLLVEVEETPVQEEPSDAELIEFFNTASLSDLVELKSIGESRAKSIIEARPFSTLEDAREASKLPIEPWNESISILR